MTDPRLFDTPPAIRDTSLRPAALPPQPRPRPAAAAPRSEPRGARAEEVAAPPIAVRGLPRNEVLPGGAVRGLGAGALRTAPIPLPGAAPTVRTRGRAAPGRGNIAAVAAIALLGAVTTGAIVLPAQADEARGTLSAQTVAADQQGTDAPAASGAAPAAGSDSPAARAAGRALAETRGAATARVEVPTRRPPSATADATAASGGAATSAAAPARPSWSPGGSARDLRAILAARPEGRTTSLGAGAFGFSDFAASLIGADLGTSGGLRGAGSQSTTISMSPRSSSKAGAVPHTDWLTNQLYLMSVTGASPVLSGFTLRGTSQGHLYNGVRIGQASGARVDDVAVIGIPGDQDIPPGETFGINDWRTSGSVYSHIEVDGAGKVGASGFATNSSTDVTVHGGDFHDLRANGTAFWQTAGVTLDDVTVRNNVTGLNFERTTGSIVVNRPTFGGNNQDVFLASDQGSGSLVITDPTFGDTYSGHKINIQVPKSYRGTANHYDRSSVKVLIGGVDRTADVVHWVGNS